MRAIDLSLIPIMLAFSACGSSGDELPSLDSSSDDSPKSPATPDATGNSESDAGSAPEQPCADSEPKPDTVCVRKVTGRVVDENGEVPPVDSLVSVCGPICYAGKSQKDGSFTVDIDRYLVPSQYSTLLHGRPIYAGYYFPMDPEATGPDVELGDLTVFHLPQEGPAIPEETAEEVTLESAGVRLTLPAGSEAKFDFEALNAGEKALQFRALQLTRDEAKAAVGEVEADVFFAISPFETEFKWLEGNGEGVISVQITFPNDHGFAAGAELEVLALGSYLFPEFVEPAAFEVVAQAVVSEDGETIEFEPENGLELLTWVAFRERSK